MLTVCPRKTRTQGSAPKVIAVGTGVVGSRPVGSSGAPSRASSRALLPAPNGPMTGTEKQARVRGTAAGAGSAYFWHRAARRAAESFFTA